MRSYCPSMKLFGRTAPFADVATLPDGVSHETRWLVRDHGAIDRHTASLVIVSPAMVGERLRQDSGSCANSPCSGGGSDVSKFSVPVCSGSRSMKRVHSRMKFIFTSPVSPLRFFATST